MNLNRADELMELYSDMMEKYPNQPLWYQRAGSFSFSQGRFDQSVEFYRQAWQKSEQAGIINYDAFDGYLLSLLRSENYEDVFSAAREHVDDKYAPVAYLRMAGARLAMGDREGAVEYCRSALKELGESDI